MYNKVILVIHQQYSKTKRVNKTKNKFFTALISKKD